MRTKRNLKTSLVIAVFLVAVLPGSDWATGAQNALDFDGTDDMVKIPDDPSLDLTSAITIEAWINPAAYHNWDRIVAKPWASSQSPWNVWSLILNNDPIPKGRLEISVGATQYSANSVSNVPLNQWTHLAGSYDGETIRIFFNGVEEAANPSPSGDINTNNMVVYIGYNTYFPSELFEGVIDEVRLWNVALDETTIQNWMYSEVENSHANYANLVSYWKMNEGAGQTVVDSKGSNDGTLGESSASGIDDPTWVLSTAPVLPDLSIIYVDADASPGGNGQSWATAYKYLKDALNKPPISGDEIWVAEGTYKPDQGGGQTPGDRTATFQLIDGVALYGGFAGTETTLDERDWQAHPTILSGDIGTVGINSDNSYRVVTGSGTNNTAVLNGFTITAGNADGSWPFYNGGGMYNDDGSPTITNCTFSENSAKLSGAGMWNYKSDPDVTNCTFSGNLAVRDEGGGLFNLESSPTLTNCTFSGNSSGYSGGGIFNYRNSSPVLTNCTFTGNSSAAGGGMYTVKSNATLTNCVFIGNLVSQLGGGMYNSSSNLIITNCVLGSNSAGWGGAGIYDSNSSPMLSNCTFIRNSAGPGLNNYGGGMLNNIGSSPTLTNCILWGNTAPSGPEIYNDGTSSVSVNYSDVQGGWPGTDNINADPCFVDADGPDNIFGTADDNLRLSADSNCIDAGDNTAVPSGVTTDLDGHPRIVDGDGNITALVDMGAYEFNWTYIGDFDNNWIVDLSDFAVFGRAFSSEPGDPEWNRFCDISIPADNYIDRRDLDVFSDNWLAQARFSPIPHLLFSEYVEGFGYNQAVEIYNAGDVVVYLGACEVRIYNNGSFFPLYIVPLNAVMLAPGEVFVLGHPGISVPSFCDQLSAGLSFSGNDAIELAYQGAPHDVIGQIGFDPGYLLGWGSGGITTIDHTLRRKCSVSTGDWFGYDSFDPAVEWEAFPVNTFDGLGSYCQ